MRLRPIPPWAEGAFWLSVAGLVVLTFVRALPWWAIALRLVVLLIGGLIVWKARRVRRSSTTSPDAS